MKNLINDSLKNEKEDTSDLPDMKTSKMDDINKELIELMQRSRAKIYVIGAGGAGNNTISRLTEVGIEGAEAWAGAH